MPQVRVIAAAIAVPLFADQIPYRLQNPESASIHYPSIGIQIMIKAEHRWIGPLGIPNSPTSSANTAARRVQN
ncbi:MAG: hypothetical protein COC21_03245 [Verrucomicrobiales bacterium]|jgi:hypothetical protein|nr:MAG: hypothetical protein COC21_03245 [Verrucomicrobiales bacterium]